VLGQNAEDGLTYELKKGIFRKMTERAVADPKHKYAIFIDEIIGEHCQHLG